MAQEVETIARRTSPVRVACDTTHNHAGVGSQVAPFRDQDEEQTCGLVIESGRTSLWKIFTGTALVDSAPTSHVPRPTLQESGQDVQESEPGGRRQYCHLHRASQKRTEEVRAVR
ncbi:hypothetical protein FA95DRAFT_1568163 [Auriscalpium vulgare]|uniref:Uncharacterized protein n=1 Tax=Auriscalpium vulgare TaxID=40419 RepID=A0ACB8R1J5_9AGAM|nr:hypothetical protein FA95DRAFT_1568163 [Auriscalpium vulgare]